MMGLVAFAIWRMPRAVVVYPRSRDLDAQSPSVLG